MDARNEILDAIQILIGRALESTTKIYNATCKGLISGNVALMRVNGVDTRVVFYGNAPDANKQYRVFVPEGNMSNAFMITGGGTGGSKPTVASYTALTDKPSINDEILIGNKTSKELKLYGDGNEPPYPVTSVNGQTGDVTIEAGGVTSVNGKSGDVTLTASDVGALPSTTKIPSATSDLTNDSGFITNAALAPYAKTADVPTKTSQLNNDSGFVDAAGASAVAPVQSVAGKTGAVTLSKADVGLGNVDNTSDANKPISTATQTALNGKLDKTAVVDVTADAIKGQAADAKSVYDVIQELPTGTDISLGLTAATVGQTVKVKAVDADGKPTAWEAVEMSGGGGGHWETVLDTVWEQDVINPTAFDSGTGIFTCAEGELNNLELNKEYVFFQQCTKEGAAYNTILNNENMKLTKLSDTTFSIDFTPPTTFVPTNVKFSRGACLAITDIAAKKIRLTLDGQFKPTATLYDKPFYGMNVPYFGRNTGYLQIRNAYQAYQQVTAEVESPYRIVGEILCGFNAPSQNKNFHFKNNSFCCPLVPYVVPEGNERNFFLTSDGTKIAKLYSTSAPWMLGGRYENTAILNDYLKIISGTKVKLERWVE